MSPFGLLPPWIALLVTGALGRVVLSLLPAGRPGAHFPRELPATWAASHVLGLITFGVQHELCAQLGVDLPTWLHLAPWAVVGSLRVLLLPGQVTPRHAPSEQARGRVSALGAVLIAGAALSLLPVGLAAAAAHGALCVLLLEGARTLRRRPAERTLFVAALAWTPVLLTDASLLPHLQRGALLLAATAAGGVAWQRRADRRGFALAVCAATGLGIIDPRLVVVAWLGLAALVLTSALPWRGEVTGVAAAGALLGFVVLSLQDLGLRGGWVGLEALDLPDETLLWSAAGVAGLVLGAGRRRRPGPIQPPARELAWLAALALAIVVGTAGVSLGVATHLVSPIAALAACAGLVPAEEPAEEPA